LDLFLWALQNATNTIVENQRVVTKVYFPRVILPPFCRPSGLLDLGISFLMFIVLSSTTTFILRGQSCCYRAFCCWP